MSDKWEVVGGGAKKKRTVNGDGPKSKNTAPKIQSNNVSLKSSFPVDIAEILSGPDAPVEGLSYGSNMTDSSKKIINKPASPIAVNNKKSKKETSSNKNANQKAVLKEKRTDLETTLRKVSSAELLKFYDELRNAGSVGDVYLSWIKYSADALNTKLNNVIPPDVSQWPNDLVYPRVPNDLVAAIQKIISQTAETHSSSADVIGTSFASLLASIPTLIQRNDPGWGYLLFLRELCRYDPQVLIRRSKSYSELIESYGNRKDIGTCILWVASQAAYGSPYLLKIVTDYLLPFYNYKHYKSFIIAALSAICESAANMAGESIIESDEFEEFFEASFDPKKRREFEKFYPRVKDLTLKNIKHNAWPLFLKFLTKVGSENYSPVSPHGREVLEVLRGVLESDSFSTVIDRWRENIGNYSRETVVLLNHLSKLAEPLRCEKTLEKKLIQSDEFAVAAVKSPELLRAAKKLQAGFKRVAASKKRFSWKMGSSLLVLTIIGILWLDVMENGQGSFEKSNTGQLLDRYGILDETMLVIKAVVGATKALYEYAAVLFRSLYEGVRPVLQSLGDKVEVYIPQVVHYFGVARDFLLNIWLIILNFLQQNVFVGVLSPENLRYYTKESLAFIWTNVYNTGEKVYALIGQYVKI